MSKMAFTIDLLIRYSHHDHKQLALNEVIFKSTGVYDPLELIQEANVHTVAIFRWMPDLFTSGHKSIDNA